MQLSVQNIYKALGSIPCTEIKPTLGLDGSVSKARVSTPQTSVQSLEHR